MRKNLKPKLRAIKPLLRQVLFLKHLEAEMNAAYTMITDRLVEDLMKQVALIEPLNKSDGDFPDDFTRKMPRFEIDLSSISELIEKYMNALRYTVLGKAAGKEAEDAVTELRIKTKVPAGGVVQGYLSALDAHSTYMNGVLNKEGSISGRFTKKALDFIREKTGLLVDSKVLELRSRTLTTLQDTLKDLDMQNEAAVREYVLSENFLKRNISTIKEKQALVKEAIYDVFDKKTPVHLVKQRLKDTTKDYGTNWTRVVRTEMGLASGAASQQAIADIAGHEDPVVAIVVTKDDRLSPECSSWSLNEDASYKYFKMSTLKPAGYNLGRRKIEWRNSVPSRHYNCFTGDTWIMTEHGPLRVDELPLGSFNIDGSLYVKEPLKVLSGTEDEFFYSSGVFEAGEQEVFKISLASGHNVSVSHGHDMLVKEGGKLARIIASDIQIGMVIPLYSPELSEKLSTVESVTSLGVMKVYGITEPRYNSVVANGIVTGNCRCHIAYIPSGFKLDQYGSLIPLKDDEELTLENNS